VSPTDDRTDLLARALDGGLTRRRVLLVGALGLVGASLPRWAWPGAASADDDPCPTCAKFPPGYQPCCVRFGNNVARVAVGQCYDPSKEQCCTGPLPNDPWPTVWICGKSDTCAPAPGSGGPICIKPTCDYEDQLSGRETATYDPETECCGKFGVEPRDKGWSFASCAATRVPRPGFRPSSNGCGTATFRAPPAFAKAGFTPACNAHDICYDTCNKTQDDCDDAFRKSLARICNRRYGKNPRALDACENLAAEASIALRVDGGDAYRKAQKEACICCPGPMPPPPPPPPKKKKKKKKPRPAP
jgi:Group XII secretory phospholipase A2 precursor (PLA2G12)